MKWLDKLKPTKGAAYIKGNALPESDHETATGRALYTITAIRKAYDAGFADGVAQQGYALQSQQAAAEPVTANNDHVICPNCCNQFRAIPVNVQDELRAYEQAADKLAMENLELRGVVAKCLSMLHFMNDNGYRLEEYEQGRLDAAIKDSERVMKTWQERIDTPENRLSPQHLHVSVEEIQAAMQAEIDDLRARLKAFEDLQPVAWTVRMGIDYLSKGMGVTVFPDSEGRDVPLFTWEKL